MQILAIILILIFALGSIGNVAMVGKPRKPVTAGQAAFTSTIHVALIIALVVVVF